jgi:anthranilate phosphoribosyltransferase
MANVFDKMATLAGFSSEDFDEFFAVATELSPGEIGSVLGYLLGRFDAQDAAAMVSVLRRLHPQYEINSADGRTTVNMVGTGGGPSTFNITTTAVFVVAAAGLVVVKTGSGAWRSRAGFVDVATKLGTLKLAMPWELIESIANDVGIVFVPPYYHAPQLGKLAKALTLPVFRNVASYINRLGPLLSPVRVDYRFIGASSRRCLEMLSGACRLLGDFPATIVASRDGLDEISTRAPTDVVHLSKDGIRQDNLIDPAALGIKAPSLAELQGHDPSAAARCCETILRGQGTDAQTRIVALNAAAVLTYAGCFPDLQTSYHAALRLIDQGEALRKLHQLREHLQCARR